MTNKPATAIGCLALTLIAIVLPCGGCLGFAWIVAPSQVELAKIAEESAAKEKHEAHLESLENAKLEAKEAEEADRLLTQSILWGVELDKALENAGVSGIAATSVDGFKATMTVNNEWHLLPYQIRLQAAQNLWKSWARIASPKDVDKARLKLVDLNGNEVGGSRVLAGSLIWVAE
jgi:hypothetical protein